MIGIAPTNKTTSVKITENSITVSPLLSRAARALLAPFSFHRMPFFGPGRRTINTLHKEIAKSHAGKPPSYFKPNISKHARAGK